SINKGRAPHARRTVFGGICLELWAKKKCAPQKTPHAARLVGFGLDVARLRSSAAADFARSFEGRFTRTLELIVAEQGCPITPDDLGQVVYFWDRPPLPLCL